MSSWSTIAYDGTDLKVRAASRQPPTVDIDATDWEDVIAKNEEGARLLVWGGTIRVVSTLLDYICYVVQRVADCAARRLSLSCLEQCGVQKNLQDIIICLCQEKSLARSKELTLCNDIHVEYYGEEAPTGEGKGIETVPKFLSALCLQS